MCPKKEITARAVQCTCAARMDPQAVQAQEAARGLWPDLQALMPFHVIYVIPLPEEVTGTISILELGNGGVTMASSLLKVTHPVKLNLGLKPKLAVSKVWAIPRRG